MDVNANLIPTPAANKAASVQNDPHLDESQAPALPFQAMLEQRPAPNNPPANGSPANNAPDEKAINQEIATQKLAETAEKSTQPAVDSVNHSANKQSAENAIDQLNFSRHLRAGTFPAGNLPTALSAHLVTGKDANEHAWVDALKQSMQTEKPLVSTQPSTTSHVTDAVFAQKMQPLADDLDPTLPSNSKLLAGSQLQIEEGDDASNAVVVKTDKDARRDQSMFALEETRDIRSIQSDDTLPLSKKVADKDVILSGTETTNNVKGAFTLQSETHAFSSSTAHSNAQPISMMPSASTAQAATLNAPTAVPTMQLHSQLGSEAWQQQLSQQMLFFTRQGVSQAQIRLHPEELGSLNVHLRIEDNQAVMHFVSPHSHVRAAMESMMPVLRSALQESGIHLAQGSVGQDNFNGQSDAQQQNASQHDGHIIPSHSTVGPTGISEATATTSAQKMTMRQGGINTFA